MPLPPPLHGRPRCGTPVRPGGTPAADPGVTVGVLGPVRAWQAGRLLPPGPAQRQLVLAVLALRAGTAVPREELVDALWEQAPASAVNTVHKHVCALRAVLEPAHPRRGGQLLATVAGGYELRLAPGAVDALAFAADTARARQAAAAGDLPAAAAAAVGGAAALARQRAGRAGRPAGPGPGPGATRRPASRRRGPRARAARAGAARTGRGGPGRAWLPGTGCARACASCSCWPATGPATCPVR